jgi:hypothetical protein
MSGIFSRTLYDECNNKETVNISTGPGVWTNNTIQKNPSACFSNYGPRNTRLMNSSELNIDYNNAIDVENSLYGLDIPLSRCMTQRTLIERDQKLNNTYNNLPFKKEPESCNNFLDLNYTRLEEPLHISEKPYPAFSYPIIDPRAWVYYGEANTPTYGNVREGAQTRYDTKMKLEEINAQMRIDARKLNSITGSNY